MDNVTAPIMSIQNAVSGLSGYLAKLEQDANIDASSLAAMKRQIDYANAAAGVTADNMQMVVDNIEAATGKQNGFNSSIRQGQADAGGLAGKIGAAVAAYASIQTVKGVAGLSDELTSTTARLNNMNDGLQTTDELQQMIYQSAQRSRGAYTETANTVAKLGTLAGGAFSSSEEIIAFAEQMNKQFVVGGASIQEQASAMRQLTQAMASGQLRGDELVSISENAPLLKRALEDAMTPLMTDANGKVKGTFKEWASEGLITADVIKYALFSVADETDAKFANMPLTWGQLWTTASNALLMAFQPVLEWIGAAAGWIRDNWERVAPIFYAVAAGAIALAAGLGIQAVATWIANGAAKAFFVTLLSNPLTYIVIAIGLIVMALYKWAQSVGGIKIAWMIVANYLKVMWDMLKIMFFTGVYWVIDLVDKLKIGWVRAFVAIVDHMGDTKANILALLQSMINGAISLINKFIELLNKIPGVNIGLIGQVTFGTEALIKNEAEKQARANALAAYENDINAHIAEREAQLNTMRADMEAGARERLAGIEAARAENAAKEEAGSGLDYDTEPPTIVENTAAIAGNTAKTADYSEEELKLWRDIAERDTINRFTTAEVTVDFGGITNNVASDMDLDGIVNYISEGIEETLSVVAKGVYA
jgi:tape measure domain-containing protein